MIDSFEKMNVNLMLEIVRVCFSKKCHNIEIEYSL